ncbi:MAG: hypothetical protein ACRDP3_21625, partial [Streptomyces sp.]|uniref:hypothetical protein n=1 Tax=Streptomyces sp. TaxID=1931 RepID=UPI003D6B8C0C
TGAVEPGAHPTRQSGLRPAHHQHGTQQRSADTVGRPSRKIEANALRLETIGDPADVVIASTKSGVHNCVK